MIRRLILSGLLLLSSYFLYSYTFQGVQSGMVTAFPRLITPVSYLYWTFFVIVMGLALSGLFGYSRTRFFQIGIHAWVITLVSQLVLAVFLLSEDVFRLGYSWLATTQSAGLVGRNPLVSQIGFAIAGIPFVSFLYGMTKGKYKYTVHKHVLHFEDLPSAFDGFRITQISDIHAGSFDNPEAVQSGIDKINELGSDLFVFTGDLVNNEAREIEPWIPFFKQIKASEGKFSILGNHDYGDYVSWPSALDKHENLERLKGHHAQIGFQLLLDQHVDIQRDGQSIKLVGVENWGIGFGKRGNLNKALQNTDHTDFKILLSHDPSHWEEEVKHHDNPIHLTLSGHTHGMQFGIEKFGIKWSPVKLRYKHWAGLAAHANRFLYINRGFGFLGFSGRVGIWPEITVLELRKK